LVDKNTQVKKSEYEAWKDDDFSVQLMPLDKAPDVMPFAKISCEAKVLQVNDIMKMANGKKLQTAIVANKLLQLGLSCGRVMLISFHH